MPFGAAFVERVEFVLSGGKIAVFDEIFDFFVKTAVCLSRERLFLTERQNFAIGGFEFGEFACRLVALFAFEESVFGIFCPEFCVFRV